MNILKMIIFILITTFVTAFVTAFATKSVLQPEFSVKGIIQYQKNSSLTVSGVDPEGYYIESSVFGRVYLESSDINSYLNKCISAKGPIRKVTGNDGYPSYPLIEVKKITVIP